MEGPARQLLGYTANRLNVSMVELAQIEAVLRIRSGTFRQQDSQQTARSNAAEQLNQAYNVLECSADAAATTKSSKPIAAS